MNQDKVEVVDQAKRVDDEVEIEILKNDQKGTPLWPGSVTTRVLAALGGAIVRKTDPTGAATESMEQELAELVQGAQRCILHQYGRDTHGNVMPAGGPVQENNWNIIVRELSRGLQRIGAFPSIPGVNVQEESHVDA